MKNDGLTLVELMVSVSIVGVIVIAAGFSYKDWLRKYNIERATKEIYSDLMHTRLLAVASRVNYIVVLNARSYTVSEDSNENNSIDAGETLAEYPRTIDYELSKNGSGNKVYIDKMGQVTPYRTIRIASDADPDYDCIKIHRTRLIMGKYDGTECDPK